MVTNRVGIVEQFLTNAKVNGEQAARTLDDLARNALFATYLGGNTRVRTTLGTAGPTIAVDDVRGFSQTFVNGVLTAVSGSATVNVTVGASIYVLNGFTIDGTNVSTVPGGTSGTLTFSTNVSTTDGTAGNAVASAIGPSVMRPSGRGTSLALQATDTLTMSVLLDAVAQLRSNAVPEIDGAYNCYLDPKSARQLFADQDFQRLFQGATSVSQVFKHAMVNDFLGLRFYPTTEAFVQPHPTLTGLFIRRPIVCGAEALIEGTFDGIGATDVAPADSMIDVVDDVAMVTREALDRLQQIIAQSWYWIGGYCTPSDTTANPTTIPTASNSAFKRAIPIEHIG